MSVLGGKSTFLIKIGQGNIGAKLIFPKYLFWAYIGGLKVKSDFSTYFSKESSNPKNIFCIINLVQLQVYRVEKVGKNLLYLSKKNDFLIFSYFNLRAHL
jgi:hypothetical protein